MWGCCHEEGDALAVIVLLAVAVIGAISAMQNDTSGADVVPGTACPTNSVNDLVAQSVPSASLVPCVAGAVRCAGRSTAGLHLARHHSFDDGP